MLLSKLHFRRVLFALVVPLLFPVLSSAQYPQPEWLGISPSSLYRPGFYTLCAGNGAFMTLDIHYEFSGGGGGPIYGWPSLDGSGCARIYADESTPLGAYYFTAAKNTLNEDWVAMNAQVTIAAPPPPPNFSVSIIPVSSTIDQGQSASYSISFSTANGFNSQLSLSITTALPSGVSAWFSPNPAWPAGGSTLTIAASPYATTGSFNFTVQASGGGIIHSTSASATVNPRQPNSISFAPTSGYAGNPPCYTLTVGNAANMTADFRYNLNFSPRPDVSITMDANGQWQYCPGHYDATGQYDFTAVKNHARADWFTLSPAVSYYLWPPKPTSLSISPSSIIGGQSYRMTVGNGALVTMNTRFSTNGGLAVTAYNWPSLSAVSPGSPDGQADIVPAPCPTGIRHFTEIANSLNSVWVSVSASVTVNSAAPPSVTSVTPAGGIRGASVAVTISGSHLCLSSISGLLSTTWPGLTFSNVTIDGYGNAVYATFNISSSASLGNATVTLTAGGGSPLNFTFTVLPPVVSTKEYIYLGPRVIATEVP